MGFGRGAWRVAAITGLAVVGLSLVGRALAPPYDPQPFPEDMRYGSLPPVTSPAAEESATAGIHREGVRIRVRDTALGGTVLSPNQAGRHPAVVLVHGAGAQRRTSLIEVAEHFARSGIVALVYDKRSVGYSAATHRDFPLLAADALAGVELLRERDDVDPARVGLWGISEGGWVVPIAAARAPEAVAFVVLVSAPSMSPLRQLGWWVDNGLRDLRAPSGLRGAAATALGMGGFDYVRHNPIPALRQVRQPVLAVYGVDDDAVPPAESARRLSAALDRGGNASYTIRFFADADHGLRVPEDGFAPGYLRTVTAWVDGLPATAQPPPGTRVAGATPSQSHLTAAVPQAPWYATSAALTGLLAVALAGLVAGPVVARIARRRAWPSQWDRGGHEWHVLRRQLRWLAVSAVSVHLLLLLVLAGAIVLALGQLGGAFLVQAGWLVVRLTSVATVVLAAVVVHEWATAVGAGWHPSPVQALSLSGTLGAAGLLLIVAAYWGVFAPTW